MSTTNQRDRQERQTNAARKRWIYSKHEPNERRPAQSPRNPQETDPRTSITNPKHKGNKLESHWTLNRENRGTYQREETASTEDAGGHRGATQADAPPEARHLRNPRPHTTPQLQERKEETERVQVAARPKKRRSRGRWKAQSKEKKPTSERGFSRSYMWRRTAPNADSQRHGSTRGRTHESDLRLSQERARPWELSALLRYQTLLDFLNKLNWRILSGLRGCLKPNDICSQVRFN
jgi:hypothetical protein